MLRSIVRILAITAATLGTIYVAFALLLTQPVFGKAKFAGNSRAEAERLEHHVRFLTSLPRCSGEAAELARAADYIREVFARYGARTSDQIFTVRGKSYRNVIASYGPRDGARLIIGAHYDAFCEPAPLPGADDNASGVAGVLELARLFATRAPSVRVDLVAYANEEPPFFGSDSMGSRIHAQSIAKHEVIGMLSLEMIGFFQADQPWPSWVLRSVYPNDGRFVAVVGRWRDGRLLRFVKRSMVGAGTRTVSFRWPSETGIDASDHRSYWAAGIPAVMITDTAYLRNPNYHTARDTAETLDYARMARVVDGVYNAAMHAQRSSAQP